MNEHAGDILSSSPVRASAPTLESPGPRICLQPAGSSGRKLSALYPYKEYMFYRAYRRTPASVCGPEERNCDERARGGHPFLVAGSSVGTDVGTAPRVRAPGSACNRRAPRGGCLARRAASCPWSCSASAPLGPGSDNFRPSILTRSTYSWLRSLSLSAASTGLIDGRRRRSAAPMGLAGCPFPTASTRRRLCGVLPCSS